MHSPKVTKIKANAYKSVLKLRASLSLSISPLKQLQFVSLRNKMEVTRHQLPLNHKK